MSIALRGFEYIKKAWKDTQTPKIGDWILAFTILMLSVFFFVYTDINTTVYHSLKLIDYTLTGNFFEFYQFTFINAENVAIAAYDIPIYIVLSLWNAPIYAIYSLLGANAINYNTNPVLFDVKSAMGLILWSKILLVIVTIVCGYLVYKICLKINYSKDKAKWSAWIFLSSIFVAYAIGFAGQYDIFGLCIMLIGIKELLNGKKYTFLLLFGLASGFKFFSLFALIPIVLLMEKRVLYIIRNIIISSWGAIVCKLLFAGNEYYKLATSGFTKAMFDTKLFSIYIKGSIGPMPLFIVGYIILCVYCYMNNTDKNENKGYFYIYAAFASFALFACFVPFNYYWLIMLAPFISIIVMAGKHNKLMLFLEIAVSFSYLFVRISSIEPFAAYNGILFKFLKKIPVDCINKAGNYLSDLGLDIFIPAFAATFTVSLILMLIIMLPRKGGENIVSSDYTIYRSVLLIRLFIPLLLTIVTIIPAFFPLAPVMFDTTKEAKLTYKYDVLKKTLRQSIMMEKSTIESVTLKFKLLNVIWNSSDKAWVEFKIQDKNGKDVFEKRLSISQITNKKNGNVVKIKTKNLQVEKNQIYYIVLDGFTYDYPKVIPATVKDNDKLDFNLLYVDDVPTNKNLYINVRGK